MTPVQRWRNFIGGEWVEGSGAAVQIAFPWDGSPVAELKWADGDQLTKVGREAQKAFDVFKRCSRISRSRLLAAMSRGIESRRKEFVQAIVLEAGKPESLAQTEVSRAVQTFLVASEQCKSLAGELIPMDLDDAGRAYGEAQVLWVPRGPILGITPFNFPLNLVAHKVAPALASGCSIVIKAAPQTPGGAHLLAEVFESAQRETVQSAGPRDSIPLASVQVIHCDNRAAQSLVSAPVFSTVSFTGSATVGFEIQKQCPGKRVILELGGNAAVVVFEDADLKRAAQRIAVGGYSYAGQTCISVQRILVQRGAHDRFLSLLLGELKRLSALPMDPRDPSSTVGPVVNEAAAQRLQAWVAQAKDQGAQVLFGGEWKGRSGMPTLLSGVSKTLPLACEEAFGPVAILDVFDAPSEAWRSVNESRFGLQVGVFTESLRLSQEAALELEVGGVLINEIPTYRADHMPYGGVKASGLGREGVRYAMEEFSERRIVIHWRG